MGLRDYASDRCGLGPAKALWIARASHLTAVVGLIALGIVTRLGVIYGVGVAFAIASVVVQNVLVRPTDLRRVTLAFSLHGGISLILAAAAVTDILL